MRTILLIFMGGWLTACSGSVYESGGGTAAVGAAGAGSSGGSGASSGTVIATGGAISGKTDPAAVPPAQMDVRDPRPEDLSNIPGIQEVHWMASYNRCRDLFNKLKREGNNLTDFKFYASRMPGGRGQGHCKLIGPDTIDNRFADRRYDTDN
jgi:hypothetical protein